MENRAAAKATFMPLVALIGSGRKQKPLTFTLLVGPGGINRCWLGESAGQRLAAGIPGWQLELPFSRAGSEGPGQGRLPRLETRRGRGGGIGRGPTGSPLPS